MSRFLGTIQLVTEKDGRYSWVGPDGRKRYFDRNLTLGQVHAHITSIFLKWRNENPGHES